MGSVFLDVTSGAEVRVEVGDRTRTNPQGALTFDADDWMETDGMIRIRFKTNPD